MFMRAAAALQDCCSIYFIASAATPLQVKIDKKQECESTIKILHWINITEH